MEKGIDSFKFTTKRQKLLNLKLFINHSKHLRRFVFNFSVRYKDVDPQRNWQYL